MATRRNYRKPQGYRDGGAVPPETTDELAPVNPPEALPTAPPAHADGGGVTGPGEEDAIKRVLAATRHAEELQRQARQPATVEDHIASLPISDHKKSFLRQNPLLLHPEIVPIAARAYQQAMQNGVPDDTEEMNARLVDGVRQEIEGRRERMVQSAQQAVTATPPKPEPPIEKMAEQLSNEAEAMRLTTNAENTTPITVSAELPPAERTQSRRSLPISAPVSRDVPPASGQRMSEQRTVTLSKEERDLAHSSYSWMSKAEAEWEYATQKLRLRKLRESGEYPERERN